jgi:putative transposase
MVDTLGLVLKAFVTEAHYSDSQVARWLLGGLGQRFPSLRKLWADNNYRGTLVEWVAQHCPFALSIVERPPGIKGFQLVAHRWVSERTFAWLNTYRRLSKDYEYLMCNADATIYVAMIHLMTRRLARLDAPS